MPAGERICQDLNEYLADDLNEKQKDEFEAHLPSCGACSEEVELDHNLDTILSQIPNAVVIPASLNSVYSTQVQKARQKTFYRRSLLVAVAIVLLGFLSIFVFHTEKPNEEISDSQTERSLEKVASAIEYKLYDPRESVAKITPKNPKEILAVSYPTENKNITMVFLYPVESQSSNPQKNKRDDTSFE